MNQSAYDYFFRKLESKPDAKDRVVSPIPFDEKDIKTIHLVGICGKAMASLAGLFVKAGYVVTGSDDAWNPPMSVMLEHIGIRGSAFNENNLDGADLVIMGNAFSPKNVEAVETRKRGLPQISSAEAYARFFIKEARSIVIAGTHGKTTTSSLAAHIFIDSSTSTNALIGGVVKNIGESYYYAGSDAQYSIVEGDEYDTAYFDKGPKFLHYRPTIGVITSVEFDHSDIYDDIDDYVAAFVFFAAEIPNTGYLLMHDAINLEHQKKIEEATSAKILSYGLSTKNAIYAHSIRVEKNGQRFDVSIEGKEYVDFFIPMFGTYNVENAVSVIAIAIREGIEESSVRKSLMTFQGAEQRQQVLYEDANVTLIDDFAHHPTAVRVTLQGIRDHYPNRRILVIFEPRSNASRRKDFEQPYSEAFDAADIILLKTPPFRHNDSIDNFMDVAVVVDRLKGRNKEAQPFDTADAIVEYVLKHKKPGDVIVVMSNGYFDGLRERLVSALA